jgi:hypothetical membrane protein
VCDLSGINRNRGLTYCKSPVLPLELVETETDLNTIASIKDVRTFIENQLPKDYLFIALYVLLFGSLALTGMTKAGIFQKAGWISALFVLMAGVFELLENRGMYRALSETTEARATCIRYPSLTKLRR